MSHQPFVPRHGRVDDRRPPTADEIQALKAEAREGANRLHSRAATTKAPQLTEAESAAIARRRIDNGGAR